MSTYGEKVNEVYQICGFSRCGKTIQTKDPKQCEVCHRYFHTRCITFRSILVRGIATLACAICVDASNNTRARLETSLGGGGTQKGHTTKKSSSAPPSTTPSRSQSPTAPTTSRKEDVTLHDVLEAVRDVSKRQEEAAESMRAATNSIAALEAKLALFERRLSALDALPQLQARMENAEQVITELRARVTDLSSRPPSTQSPLNNSVNSVPPLSTVPSEIASLRRELLRIKQQQGTATNNVVVLTGLRYTRETRIDLLAYSVVSALDPSVHRRDIAGARVMGRIDAATDTQSADGRPPPIAVTLSSHALARSTIRAKIRKGKLHTAELDASILEEAKAPNHQGLININELLPPEIHKLRVRARQEVKRRPGCRSYVRDGNIFVRSPNNADRATIVSSEEDLAAFLARIPPASNNSSSNNNNNNSIITL